MANPEFGSRSVLDSSDPLYLHPSDNPGMVLVSKVFDGASFGTWKRSMLIALSAKNKIGFVNGAIARPNLTDAGFRTWERCNDMVVSWMLNALSKEIAESVIFANSASEIWFDLCTRFEQSNLAQTFSVIKDLCTISQGNDSFSTYYTRIKHLWDAKSALQLLPGCTCGVTQAIKKYDDDMRLIQLLMGLNESYSAVRGSILSRSPTPTILEAYSIISHEERSREIKTSTQFVPDSSAMSTQGQKHKQDGYVPTRRPSYVCSHCKKTGHKVEFCYKLIGFPSSRNQSTGPPPKRFSAQVGSEIDEQVTESVSKEQVSTIPGLTADQCRMLFSMLNQGQSQKDSMASCSMAGPFNEEATGSW